LATSDVLLYKNPLFTTESPLPLLGTDAPPIALNYCAQPTKAEVDFYPGNVIALPAEMNPPLASQHFATSARVCAGIVCAWDELGKIQPWPPYQEPSLAVIFSVRGAPVVPSGGRPDCFCLDAFVIGHARIRQLFGAPMLVGQIDAVDVPELAPPGMKAAIDCYLRDTIQMVLREKLNFPPVHTFFFDFSFLTPPGIKVRPAPQSAGAEQSGDRGQPTEGLHVSGGRGDHAAASPQAKDFDSTALTDGDIFAATILRPGKYKVSNAAQNHSAELTVAATG
jgi:hypothetical protein